MILAFDWSGLFQLLASLGFLAFIIAPLTYMIIVRRRGHW
jgi:hypothetical protein